MSDKHMLTAILVGLMLLIGLSYWLGQPAKAVVEKNTVMNFICEMRGELSNEHYDISEAHHEGQGIWALTYRDSGDKTIYAQRLGEDCHAEIFPTPAK